MSDNERALAELSRLHDEILRERAAGLRDAANTAQSRLVEREEALARLRAQVAALKRSVAAVPAPPKARVPAAPARSEAPAPVRAASTAPVPVRAAAPARPAVKTAAARTGLSVLAPYAAILACAVLIEVHGSARRSPSVAIDAGLARPAATMVASGRAAAKGVPVLGDEDRSQEALLLVHQWKLPGDAKSLGERLGGELDLPGSRPAWNVERTGEKAYRVTYQMSPESAPYAFDADLDSRVVWPAPDTQELLAPQVAALRDAVR